MIDLKISQKSTIGTLFFGIFKNLLTIGSTLDTNILTKLIDTALLSKEIIMNASERQIFNEFENAIYNRDFETIIVEYDYISAIINGTWYQLFWTEDEDCIYRLFYYEDGIESVIGITPNDDEYENCIDLVIFADTEYC